MVRLSVMMFLQACPLGCWGVTVGAFIAANTGEQGAGLFSPGFIGYSTAAGAVSSLVAPILLGYVSDRFLPTQWLVFATHLGCGASVLGMYFSQSQTSFFCWLLAYFHCYVPSVALTNKISFKHLREPDTEFPLIRFWGTVGWIGAGVFVGWVWPQYFGDSIETTRTPFLIAAIADLMIACYALCLPHTPVERTDHLTTGDMARQGFSLLWRRPLMVFLVVSLFASVPSMAYNNFCNPFMNNAGFANAAALMTLGQVSELAFLWALPWITARISLYAIFQLGVLMWAVRYLLLAVGASCGAAWPVLAAIMVHGPCFVFVYVVAQMYTDKLAPANSRGVAQGMYSAASNGVGHLLGALLAGYLQVVYLTPHNTSPPPYDWPAFWTVLSLHSLGMVFVIWLMRPSRQ